jgi:hypothetical protein
MQRQQKNIQQKSQKKKSKAKQNKTNETKKQRIVFLTKTNKKTPTKFLLT